EITDGIFIFITAYGTIPSAVEAIKKGAFDYLTKPVDFENLLKTLKKAIEFNELKKENVRLKEELEYYEKEKAIVYKSSKMKEITLLAKDVAKTDATILLTGESGTGKEILARFIHKESGRKGRFVPVNCSAIPETLLESELFGYEKGAFTGADRRKEGKVLWADNGTLFLDEIGDMPLALQGKILRLLQDKCFERVGGLETIYVDVRFIAATNQNLEEKIKEGKFREDLFYRLNVIKIHIPPLRERKEDIIPLAKYFIDFYSKKYRKEIKEVSERALENLLKYSWPGNVRELENVIERTVILTKGEKIENFAGIEMKESKYEPLKMEEVEKIHIEKILKMVNGNISKASEILGIHRNTLREKIKKYGIIIK
ncbi:MAG: sigma-54 dependent transcriptional regulator, partial [candidate division WOR-3 bacterium]